MITNFILRLVMKKIFVVLCCFTVLLFGCSDNDAEQNPLMQNAQKIEVDSIKQLESLLSGLNYSDAIWLKGIQEVPRVTFNKVSSKWQKESQHLPVEQKKSIFLRLMLSLILIANEEILQERQFVETAKLSSSKLIKIAIKYRIIESEVPALHGSHRKMLLERINIIPPSLALAQAAEESGWATSRFVIEGNAFFGQWDFSGKGIKPKQQRSELGNYGIKRFDSPLDSVRGYMLNINSGAAYETLRKLRAFQLKTKKQLSGYELATSLENYSERGHAYVQGIQHLIEYNKLARLDQVKLANNQLVYLIFE